MNLERKVKTIRNSMEFTHGVRRALTGALFLLYMVSLGFNVIAITTLFAIAGIMLMLFEFPTSAIADYDSRKKSLLISFFLFFISFLGIFIFTNFWAIASFWILSTIAWTFSTGAGSAWAIDTLNYAKKKSKIMNLISKAYIFEKLGWVIGGLIGFFIVAINFRFIWLVLSLIYLVVFFIIWKYMEERNFKPTKTPHNYLIKTIIKAKEALSFLIHKKNKELRILMIGGFLTTATISSFFVIVPLFFTQKLGLTNNYFSLLYSLLAGLSMIGPFIADKLNFKRKFRHSLFIVLFAIGISIIVFSLSQSLILAIVAFAFLQIFLTIFDVTEDCAKHQEFSSQIRASLGSIGSILWAIADSISVFLTGIGITLIGIMNTLIIGGILALITAMVYLLGLRK
jgi:MFS family permease